MLLEDDLSVADRSNEFRGYLHTLRNLQFECRSIMAYLELLLSGINGERLEKVKADHRDVEGYHIKAIALRDEAVQFINYYDIVPRPADAPPRSPVVFGKVVSEFRFAVRAVLARIRDVYSLN